MPAYRIVELRSFAALREAVQSAGLTAEVPDADVFCTQAWFANLTAHGVDASTDPLLLLALTSRGDTALCLPLMPHAAGLGSLSNYYSSLFGPMVWQASTPAASTADAWPALAEHLRAHAQRWPVLRLSPLDMRSPFYLGMTDALRQAGYVADHYFCFGNWYLQVAGRSFSEYAQTLPAPLRNSIARGQRRLARQGDWGIHIHTLPDDQLEGAIDAFVRVYAQSWKQPEPHPRFIPELARMAAAQGWLRLGVLSLQGQPIAAQLWLVKDGKASIFKLAYVDGHERYSAGSVLTHALMQHVIDTDGVREVDYLTGDDAYKRDWMSHRRERRGIVAFDLRTLRGMGAALRHFGGKLWRRQHG